MCGIEAEEELHVTGEVGAEDVWVTEDVRWW